MLALRACIGGPMLNFSRLVNCWALRKSAFGKYKPKRWRSYSRRSSVSGIEKPGPPETHPSRPAMESEHDIEWGRPLDENIVASQRELLRSWKSQFDRLAMPQSSCRKMFLSNSLKTTGKFNDRKIDVQCPQLPCPSRS